MALLICMIISKEIFVFIVIVVAAISYMGIMNINNCCYMCGEACFKEMFLYFKPAIQGLLAKM